MTQEKFAIRFGLGAIKAVGLGMTELVVEERKQNGDFKDIYDFAERVDPKNVNKKSIEALAKSGSFDSITDNRRQIAESFDIISAYATQKKEEALSPQMSLFGDLAEFNKKPELRKISNWDKQEKLQKEFEAFGFFLNEHPIDEKLSDLRKRGVIFSDKIERDELEDNSLVKMAVVVASSKHRSSARGRFAYLTLSDPFGIFEAMVFDEALITAARDLLLDGSMIAIECLIKKDEGGTRILVRDVKKLSDFISLVKPQEKDFEDIKKQPARRNYSDKRSDKPFEAKKVESAPISIAPEVSNKKTLTQVDIMVKDREAVFAIKTLLSQRLVFNEIPKTTKVFLVVATQGKMIKLELDKKYNLDEFDVKKIKSVVGVIDVEFVM